MNKLAEALASFLECDEPVGHLAQLLTFTSKNGRISYHEAERIIEEEPEDVLLLGMEWRLLLPVRTLKSAAWEDRLLLAEPGEMYEMPNIVRYLVEDASRTGYWNPEHAIAEFFTKIGEPEWRLISRIVARMGEEAEGYRLNAVQIKKICKEMGLEDRVDALIAELKAGGIMSPKLGSLAEVAKAGSPIYELNPSLFIKDNRGRE